jgi:hypothetical protein
MSRSFHGIRSGRPALVLNAAAKADELAREEQRSRFEPFAIKHYRRCRECRRHVTVICLNGAEAPVRDPHWRCADCRAPLPVLATAALEELVRTEQEPQIALALSDRSETLSGIDNEKSRHEDGSRNPLARCSGEPTQGGGRPQPGGGR